MQWGSGVVEEKDGVSKMAMAMVHNDSCGRERCNGEGRGVNILEMGELDAVMVCAKCTACGEQYMADGGRQPTFAVHLARASYGEFSFSSLDSDHLANRACS